MRGSPKAITRLLLVFLLSLGLLAPAAISASAGSQATGKHRRDCQPPDHRMGLSGWKHGDSFSLVPPPNWDCDRGATKPQCDDEGPDHRMGLEGWKHGDSFSLVPPPNWNCGVGPGATSAASASSATLPSPDAASGTGGGGGGLQVTYEVSGVAGAGIITYQNAGQDSTQASDVALPWSIKQTMNSSDFYYVSAQNAGGGTIHCKVYVNDKLLEDNTASGEYAICQSSGTL